MTWFTIFPVNAVKSTSRKQRDLCMRKLKSTTGIYESPIPRPPSFLSTPTRPAIIRFWNEVTFIDRDSHWYTRRVKEAIHVRLHPNNINRDSGIELPEAWMPTIKKHNRRLVQQRTVEGTTSHRNNEDRNASITADHREINGAA